MLPAQTLVRLSKVKCPGDSQGPSGRKMTLPTDPGLYCLLRQFQCLQNRTIMWYIEKKTHLLSIEQCVNKCRK